MKKTVLMFVSGIMVMVSSAFAADSYTLDQGHSTLGFSVAHMMVSQITGQFDQYDGTVVYDSNDLANSKINVTIQTASINTRLAKRDEHLQGADFFDAAQFPTMTFVSKNITANLIIGDLTIKGITKEVSIPAAILGPVKAMSGSMIIGISGSFKLNRQDYGITWSKTLDQGGVAVGDEVTVNINVEAQMEPHG